MNDTETLSGNEKELLDEIQEFNKERDRIRKMIGEIGGTRYSKRDNVINAVFLTIILVFFVIEVSTGWVPMFISLEISILLVSIKIVWMIHSQHKYNHFVFWVLNSVEFRQNELARSVRGIETRIAELRGSPQNGSSSSGDAPRTA